MNPHYLEQANYILDACGRPVAPKNTSYVDLPASIGYSRFMPGSTDGTYPGSEDIGGVMHKGRGSFMLRAITAQSLPRNTQGVYWRLRLPDGRFLQSALTSHAMAFGFGSDRQSLTPEIEWKAGEKLYVDLDTILAGPPPSDTGYSVAMQFEGAFRFPISGAPPAHPLTGDFPRYFEGVSQNILSPAFRFGPGCPSETPAGYQDEEFVYVSPVNGLPTSGSQVSNIAVAIEPNSDFILRAVWPFFPGSSNEGTGSVVIRPRRGDGYVMSNVFIPVNSIQGPVFPELRIKAGDNFYFDAKVIDGAGAFEVVTFGLYLVGVKRRRISK